MLLVKKSPLTEIASTERLNEAFQKQKQLQKPIYYILPSSKYLQEARKRKTGMAFKTFDDLAEVILKQANVDYYSVSESERTIFFQQLLAEQNERILEKSEELRHKAKAYADTYGQLKRIGLTISDLPPSFKNMEAIFQEYEDLWVNKNRLLDPENRIHTAVQMNLNNNLPIGGIVIDGYLDFSTLQYMVLNFFVSLGIDITIYLPEIDDVEIVNETSKQLESFGFVTERNEIVNTLAKASVKIASATTVEEEVHGVIDEIIEHHKEQPFNQIGIILADEKKYLSHLLKIANEKQIPINRPQKKLVIDSLFFQFLFQSLLKHKGDFSSKWNVVDLFDAYVRLQFLPNTTYLEKKRAFIETSFLDQELSDVIGGCKSIRHNLPKKATVQLYLQAIKDFLEESLLPNQWRSLLLTESNTKKLQQICFEWKVYDYFVQFLTKTIAQLANQHLTSLEVDYPVFLDWLNEKIQKGSIYVERAPKDGLELYTFRDVALFKGTHLYILGMNEKTIPKKHQLSGYWQEHDLKNVPIPYARPTQKLARLKEDAFFEQLFLLADHLSFSYVVGVDPHNPLLPSIYLEKYKQFTEDRKYSAANRFAQLTSYSKQDWEEKIAYHLGLAKHVHEIPIHLQQMTCSLQKLDIGEERVSSRWHDKLRREKMSVTTLESYAMCPFKFALERVLHVGEPLDKKTTVDFRDVGSMLHNIIEAFYKKVELIGQPFSTWKKEMNEACEQLLLDIFEEEWAKVEANHRDFSKLQLSIEKENWQKKLLKWWLAEKLHFWENTKLGQMRVFKLEEPIELDFKLDEEVTITLTGKIDRIDIDDQGFVIYDYKSGKATLNFDKEVRPGLKLQLPLYLFAMEQRLNTGHYTIDVANIPEAVTAHGAAYISLREPNKRASNSFWREEHFGKDSSFSVHSKATKEESLEGEVFLSKYELKKRMKELWEGSRQDFSVRPLKCIQSCLYRPVCRVTQDQIESGEEEWK